MSLQEHEEEDHVMNRAEAQLMTIELVEIELREALSKMQESGLPDAFGLEEHLNDVVIKRKISQYLLAIPDLEDRQEAVQRIFDEGLPPEVLAPEGTFVVEGSPFRQ